MVSKLYEYLYIEAELRKPTYADFMALRDDLQNMRGWWQCMLNRMRCNNRGSFLRGQTLKLWFSPQ